MSGYQQRVVAEKARHDAAREVLDVERVALGKFTKSPTFLGLHVDEQGRMLMQLGAQGRLSDALAELSGILGERIAGFGRGKRIADLIESDHGPLSAEDRASIEAG